MLLERNKLNVFVFKNRKEDRKEFEKLVLKYNKNKKWFKEEKILYDGIHLDILNDDYNKLLKNLKTGYPSMEEFKMTPILGIKSGSKNIETIFDLVNVLSTEILVYTKTIFVSNENNGEFRVLKCRELPINTIVTLNKIFEEEEE